MKLLLLAALLVSASVPARAQDASKVGGEVKKALGGDYKERRFPMGKLFVIEKSGELYIDSSTLIVADAGKAKEYDLLIKAVAPKECGGPYGGGNVVGMLGACSDVKTLDDYLVPIKQPEPLRKDLTEAMKGYDGVVLRYISTKKDRTKQLVQPDTGEDWGGRR